MGINMLKANVIIFGNAFYKQSQLVNSKESTL